MVRISLLAYPNCSISSISGPIDAFAIANLLSRGADESRDASAPLFHWDIVSLDGKTLQGYGGMTIQPSSSIHEMGATDFILIPGFLPPLEFIGRVPEELSGWLRGCHEKKIMIGTICTGAFFLAETGLLDGKTATTNWLFARNFRKRYPRVRLKPERILTEDSGIMCSGATTSFLDLCLYLIEKFGSEDLSARCAKYLLVAPNRRSQSPYCIFDFQKHHRDEKILAAQRHMEEKYTEILSVDALASNFGFSPRHFKRRFKKATGDAPLTYLQRIRIEAAKQKLETTLETIDEITWQVGYEDSNSFRRLFRKYTGLSPREYRDRFARTNRNLFG